MTDINWRKGEDLDCPPECEYILEVDLCSTVDGIVSKIIHAYYCKAADVFIDLDADIDDAGTYIREDVLRWVYFTPLKVSEVFDVPQ